MVEYDEITTLQYVYAYFVIKNVPYRENKIFAFIFGCKD